MFTCIIHDSLVLQMIHTLCMFNTDEEKRCSLLFNGDKRHKFHHDLWLQGMKRVKQCSFILLQNSILS